MKCLLSTRAFPMSSKRVFRSCALASKAIENSRANLHIAAKYNEFNDVAVLSECLNQQTNHSLERFSGVVPNPLETLPLKTSAAHWHRRKTIAPNAAFGARESHLLSSPSMASYRSRNRSPAPSADL